MVSQAGYHGHTPEGKRPSRAFTPYVTGNGYSDSRVYVPTNNDARGGMSEHTMEKCEAPTRKRIAVACGRCRQRKIRCSGDLGQNLPCSNCKNAGVAQCLFLRVSSRETSIKDLGLVSRNEFNYNSNISRALAHRSSVGPPPLSPYGSNDFGSGGVGEPFRSNTSLYPYTNKAYYANMAAPWTAGYGGDCVDYTIPTCSPYAIVNNNDSSTHDQLPPPPSPHHQHQHHQHHQQLIPYSWDDRTAKQATLETAVPSSTLPPPPHLPSMPSMLVAASTPKPAESTFTQTTSSAVTETPASTTACTAPTNASQCIHGGTANLVYRLASSSDISNGSGDLYHTPSPSLPQPPLDPGLARPPAENMGRLTGEPMDRSHAASSQSSLDHHLHGDHHNDHHSLSGSTSDRSRFRQDIICRSAAPSPAPMHLPAIDVADSPYSGYISSSSADQILRISYSTGGRSSSVAPEHVHGPSSRTHHYGGQSHSSHSGHSGHSHAAHTPKPVSHDPGVYAAERGGGDGSIFSDQERDVVGTQGPATCLDSYTYDSGPTSASTPRASMPSEAYGRQDQRQRQSKKKTSSDSLVIKARPYSPAEGPALSMLPPASRQSSGTPMAGPVPSHDMQHMLGMQKIHEGHDVHEVHDLHEARNEPIRGRGTPQPSRR